MFQTSGFFVIILIARGVNRIIFFVYSLIDSLHEASYPYSSKKTVAFEIVTINYYLRSVGLIN